MIEPAAKKVHMISQKIEAPESQEEPQDKSVEETSGQEAPDAPTENAAAQDTPAEDKPETPPQN